MIGFRSVNDNEDRGKPIKPDSDKSKTVKRIFELYLRGDMTFMSVADTLQQEDHVYCASMPRFSRTTLSYILNNRFYVGDVIWHGRTFNGKHRPLIDRQTFEACQVILKGKNRRKSTVTLPLAGGLLRCKFCGQGITGELIRRRLKDGTVRKHVYYRCGNDVQGPDHPRVRWCADALEGAIIAQFRTLKLPSPEIAEWFGSTLRTALADEGKFNRDKQASLQKRKVDRQNKRDRLLDLFLSGGVEKDVYEPKAETIRRELEDVQQLQCEETTVNSEFIALVEKAFLLSQSADETWLRSNCAERRELLAIASLNRELGDSTLDITWVKPFEPLAKQPVLKNGRGDWICPVVKFTLSQDQIAALNAPRKAG